MSYDTQTLLVSLRETEPWLHRFTAEAYPAALSSYRKQYAEVYACALAETPPEQLATALLGAVDRIGGCRGDTLPLRMVLALYLTPMLLDMGDTASELAAALCHLWAERHPRQAYSVSSFDQICRGFRKKLLGFDRGCAYDTEQKKKGLFHGIL
jgi:hypothetical protein